LTDRLEETVQERMTRLLSDAYMEADAGNLRVAASHAAAALAVGFCDQCEAPKAEVASLGDDEDLCASCLLVRVSALLEPAFGRVPVLSPQTP
jgi:hypothetical protein